MTAHYDQDSFYRLLANAREPVLLAHPKNEKIARDLAARITCNRVEVRLDPYQSEEFLSAMDLHLLRAMHVDYGYSASPLDPTVRESPVGDRGEGAAESRGGEKEAAL